MMAFRTAPLSMMLLLFSLISFHALSYKAAEGKSRDVEWPCTDTSAIQWVRHPQDCSQYYICHYGQPLSMPTCPYGQVWAKKARNCVPETSRWNDCDLTEVSQNNGTYDVEDNLIEDSKSKGQRYTPEIMLSTPKSGDVPVTFISTTEKGRVIAESPTAKSAFTTGRPALNTSQTSTIVSVMPTIVTHRPSRRPHNDYGKPVPPNSSPAQLPGKEKERSEKKHTPYETATSPYQPNPRNKYYTYPRQTNETKTRRIPAYSVVTHNRTRHTTALPQTRRPVTESRKVPAPTSAETTTTRRRTPEQGRGEITARRMTTESTLVDLVQTRGTLRSRSLPSSPGTTIPSLTASTKRTTPQAKVTGTTAAPKPVPTPRTGSSPKTRLTSTMATPTTSKRQPRPRTTSERTPQAVPKTTTVPRQVKTSSTSPSVSTTTNSTTTTTTEGGWKEGRQFGVWTPEPSRWAIKPMHERLPEDHPCRSGPGQLVGHRTKCHRYYNCTTAALENVGGHLSALEEECRYPQLFDLDTGRCREFINVRCQERFEPVDPCEYDNLQCQTVNCVPCHNRYGSCRGRDNGIYPFHVQRWTPTFVTCYQQRNIAQDDCQPPTPIFSPDVMDCVALFDVPKKKGGLRPDCSFRQDGFYPDEQGRCGIFFECRDGDFERYDECPLGTVYDPMTSRCQLLDRSTPPCGEGQDPSCADRHDGFHADPFGRCPYYFECRKNQFVRHLTCDFGSFDPLTEECVIPSELIPRPCGLLPNPCEGKPSGFYPDEQSRCRHYVECSRGVLISKATCPVGTVFSTIAGRCDRPENAPEPCGLAPSCSERKDGRYSALTRGCSFYFECRGEEVGELKQCGVQDGGFFFNERTGRCDFPQNICPPCGYRWWGCVRSLHR